MTLIWSLRVSRHLNLTKLFCLYISREENVKRLHEKSGNQHWKQIDKLNQQLIQLQLNSELPHGYKHNIQD